MKIFYLFIIAISFFSCASKKSFLERSDDLKGLSDAIKKYNKDVDDSDAKEAIPVLYKRIINDQQSKIDIYRNTSDASKFDKIISSYEKMQTAYDLIMSSNQSFKLVNPQSYTTQILQLKDSAAEYYYDLGNEFLRKGGRDNAKKAYSYFKESNKYSPGFKDATAKMEEAYQDALLKIVIFPVEDNSYFNNYNIGNYGVNYSNEYFQRTLARELNDTREAVSVYTDREAVNPDWSIYLVLRNLDIPYPSRSTYRRNSSAQIEVGTDTAGRPVYRTVYATITITKSNFIARADMQVIMKDMKSNKTISNNSYREDYRWEQESATYSGDYRALSSSDKRLIDNAYNYDSYPRKEEVLNELYRKLYPRILQDIRYKIRW